MGICNSQDDDDRRSRRNLNANYQQQRQQYPHATPAPQAGGGAGPGGGPTVDVRVWGSGHRSCEGRYVLTDQRWHGQPVWASASSRIYTDSGGYWLVGDTKEMRSGVAWFATEEPHGGRPPSHPSLRWAHVIEHGDGTWVSRAPIQIMDTAPTPLPPAAAATDPVTAVYGTSDSAPLRQFETALANPSIARSLRWSEGGGSLFLFLGGVPPGGRVPRDSLVRYMTGNRVFDLVDVRGLGAISAWDLQTALTKNREVSAHLRVPPELAQSVVRQVDGTGRGRASRLEFLHWFVRQSNAPGQRPLAGDEVVRRVLARLRVPRGGGVSLAQLEHVLAAEPQCQMELGWPARQAGVLWRLMAPHREAVVREDVLRGFLTMMMLFNRIDLTRDGYIDAEEFGSSFVRDPALGGSLRVIPAEAQSHFRAMDSRCCGVASFADFYAYFKTRLTAAHSPPPAPSPQP
eukprot:Hpha_TRINITY_DN19444_c0_g1::TRINITY_DN19444_c0_g1_i1::g.45772::m.45772